MTILHRWFKEVWNEGSESTIDELLAPNVKIHGLLDANGKEVDSVEAFKDFHKAMRSTISGINVQLEAVITEGDLTVARYVITAKHIAGDTAETRIEKPLHFTGMTMGRIKDGKIVEGWNNVDFATMMQQMQ